MSAHPARKPRHPKPEILELRPTDPTVGDLTQEGLRALDARDFARAAEVFRRALAMAPLRSDIKDLLELALRERTSGAAGGAKTRPPSSNARAVDRATIARLRSSGRRGVVGRLRKPIWAAVLTVALAMGVWGAFAWRTQDGRPLAPVAENEEILTLMARAQVFFDDGRYNDAVAALNDALRRQPGDPGRIHALQADFHHSQGLVLMEKRDYSEAIGLLRQAVELAPDNPGLRFDLGWAIHLRGMNLRAADPAKAKEYAEEARTHFQRVLDREPRHLMAANGLARASLALDQRAESVEAHSLLADIAPDSLEAKAVGQELRARGWIGEDSAP